MRLYSFPGDEQGRDAVRGCVFATGRTVSIDGPPEAYAFRGPALALAGTVVGHAEESCFENDRPCETVVIASDIAQVGDRTRVAEPGRRRGRTKIGSLRVKRNKALAWIACPGDRDSPEATRRPNCVRPGSFHYVFKLDANADPRRPQRLDRGHGIDPSSLRLSGSRLSWIKNGKRRHATLR